MARYARARRHDPRRDAEAPLGHDARPTEAQRAGGGLSLVDFGAFVERALFLDQPDPVASWGELRVFQDTLITRVAKASTLRIEAPGTPWRSA